MSDPQSRAQILVVDDDSAWCELTLLRLEELGYEGRVASNGEEALELIRLGDCAVVLLDLRMPGLSGAEVADRLPPDGPAVVFMTAADVPEAAPALSGGSRYYLPKTASLAELELMLESLRDHR